MKIKVGKKRLFIGLLISGGVLLILYGIGILFYQYHFYPNTYMQDINIGNQTISKVNQRKNKDIQTYSICIKGRDDYEEVIKGEEIDYDYIVSEELETLKESQKAFLWPLYVFQYNELKCSIQTTYDKEKLNQRVNTLKCITSKEITAPKNAYIVFVNMKYEIKKEDRGNLIDKSRLIKALDKVILSNKTELDLEKEVCYKIPTVTSHSIMLCTKRDKMNRYIDKEIIYDFKDRKRTIKADTLKNWLVVDEKGNIGLDKEKIKVFIKELAKATDTLYGVRQFKTSLGHTVTVVGGDYGFRIDQKREVEALIKDIEGTIKKVKREPIYERTALRREQNDIGTTYVEVNLTKQYLWAYKDGKLVAEGSIVSGTVSNGHATREGTYSIDYKQKHAILRGPGYRTPVTYWMPFDSGAGIHDAVWRNKFGGSIYIYNGSHGCINAPYRLAEKVFYAVEKGTPIICYK